VAQEGEATSARLVGMRRKTSQCRRPNTRTFKFGASGSRGEERAYTVSADEGHQGAKRERHKAS
jgi:hypothetical protein